MGWMRMSTALRQVPDLLIRGRFPFTFDELAIPFAGLTAAHKLNLLREGMDLLTRGDRARGRPAVLQVEPTNLCSLQCPLCPTGSRTARRPQGHLTPELFDRLLDDGARTLLCVVFYGWGEPFLNRDLPSMIAACTRRGIRTLVSTNGQHLQSPEEAGALVEAGLSALIVAIDGGTQETYERYRRGGRLERARLCLANVEEAKRRRSSDRPYTNLRAVLTQDALAELGGLETLARDSGANMFSCKTLGCMVGQAEFTQFEPQAPEFRRFPSPGATRASHRFRCPFPYRQPTVFWDGTVVGCEFDYDLEEPWGRIGDQPFGEIWNGAPAQALRNRLRHGRQEGFCRLCPYRHRAQDGSVILHREVRPAAPPDDVSARTVT
jgi:MoaA/NifB/PqqE/SkfB family radical SAM enzyme